MELDLLKPYTNHDVELLVSGLWIEGRMTIFKGNITLEPLSEAKEFYGPCIIQPSVIQALRVVKHYHQIEEPEMPLIPTIDQNNIRSAFDKSAIDGRRFVAKPR